MNHTKEPWEVHGSSAANGKSNEIHSAMASGRDAFIARVFDTSRHDEREANARRIVACVNACAGIPTELIEEGGFAAVPVATHRAVKEERDELLIGKQHLEAECREKQRSVDQLAADNATLRQAIQTQSEEAAKLMAQRDELVTWLRWSLNLVPTDVRVTWQYEQARAALAKATKVEA